MDWILKTLANQIKVHLILWIFVYLYGAFIYQIWNPSLWPDHAQFFAISLGSAASITNAYIFYISNPNRKSK